mgnify:CR=1 FL=1
MKNSNRIYEALCNRAEKICHKSMIVEIIKEYKEKFQRAINPGDVLKYLSRHSYIKRIFQSYYYINSIDERKREYCMYEDKELLFVVLNKLGIQWYVGLGSAYHLAGASWQVPRVLHIINNKFSGRRNVRSLRVIFYKMKSSLFVGTKQAKTKTGVRYFYSSPGKTALDEVYLRKARQLKHDRETKKYVRYYPQWVGKK